MNVKEELIKLKDEKYAQFQAKLTPNINSCSIIGVRVPVLRSFSKTLTDDDIDCFINDLPHATYDENMLQSVLISRIKDYEKCIYYVNKFLPYIDNWAVCDILNPNIFKKNKDKLIDEIFKWLKSKEPYTIRFAIEMLMNFYLDDDFKIEYHDAVSKIRSDEYYVNMMIAWYFATALSKKWDDTITYIENRKLDVWTLNKTIQKAKESYRINENQKKILESLKIKR